MIPRYEARPSGVVGNPGWHVYDREEETEVDYNEDIERQAGGPFPGDIMREGEARAIAAVWNERDAAYDWGAS